MHKVNLLVIGKVKESFVKDGVAFFTERLKHAVDLTITELPASREKSPELQRDDESQRILHHLQQAEGEVWVLDETGKQMTSRDFAELVQQMQDRGEPMTFVIGGAYGLSDALRKTPHRLFALSSMTLTHEMCRLFFLEQLYRATEINRGSGYHH